MKDLVHAARNGALSRRGFLGCCALALGLGEREAERELAVKAAVPGQKLTWRVPPFRELDVVSPLGGAVLAQRNPMVRIPEAFLLAFRAGFGGRL